MIKEGDIVNFSCDLAKLTYSDAKVLYMPSGLPNDSWIIETREKDIVYINPTGTRVRKIKNNCSAVGAE